VELVLDGLEVGEGVVGGKLLRRRRRRRRHPGAAAGGAGSDQEEGGREWNVTMDGTQGRKEGRKGGYLRIGSRDDVVGALELRPHGRAGRNGRVSSSGGGGGGGGCRIHSAQTLAAAAEAAAQRGKRGTRDRQGRGWKWGTKYELIRSLLLSLLCL
jgi:hypothetical protein